MQVLMSLVGVATIFCLAFLLLTNRAAINRRTLLIAFGLQTALAAFVLYVPIGGRFLDRVVRGVQFVIDQGRHGIEFVFGNRIDESLGFTVAFVGLIYLVNGLLGVFGGLVGFDDLTVQWLLGKLFAPIAFLLGFSNLASIAILLGGLGAVVLSRRHDIARLGLRAVIGGTLVNLLNASLAGFFFVLQ